MKTLKRLDITSFLILPIQRIPRYELLLRDLIKYTWPAHPDHDGLDLALKSIHEQAKNLNRAKSFSDNNAPIALLQSFAVPISPLHSTSGIRDQSALQERYFCEGELLYVDATSSIENAERRKIVVSDGGVRRNGSSYEATALSTADGSFGCVDNLVKSAEKAHKVYAFLFRNLLMLTKRTKTAVHHFGSKSSNFSHISNIALHRASISTITVNFSTINSLLHLKKGSLDGGKPDTRQHNVILLHTADKHVHYLIADSHETQKKWIADLKEAAESPLISSSETTSMGVSELMELDVLTPENTFPTKIASKKWSFMSSSDFSRDQGPAETASISSNTSSRLKISTTRSLTTEEHNLEKNSVHYECQKISSLDRQMGKQSLEVQEVQMHRKSSNSSLLKPIPPSTTRSDLSKTIRRASNPVVLKSHPL